LCGFDHGLEIGARLAQRQAAQSVVAAEFEYHDLRVMALERRRQARASAGGGVAADAGVHDRVRVALLDRRCCRSVTQPSRNSIP